MKHRIFTTKPIIVLIIVVILLGVGISYFSLKQGRSPQQVARPNLNTPSEEKFLAPGKKWPSEKKVEQYFVENLKMSPEEAEAFRKKEGSDGKIMLRLGENTTLEGLISNLKYYGFIRDEEAFRYAIEHSTDTDPGKTYALKVGNNTIDTFAYYRISEEMDAWQLADELLNHPTHFAYDEYRHLFMP
jgi:hypothetical protein